jgi:hypothetical protein
MKSKKLGNNKSRVINSIKKKKIKEAISIKLKMNKKNIQNMLQNLLLVHSIILIYRLLEKSDNKITVNKILKELKNKKLIDKSYNEDKLKDIIKLAKQKLPDWKNIKKKFINELIKVFQEEKKGGFYFRSLESKGDQPITGSDLSKLLDEMQEFFYNAKYTEEGSFLRETDTLLSLLRGDTQSFKYYIFQNVLPKYYTIYPPFLNFNEIGKAITSYKYEDYPDYL